MLAPAMAVKALLFDVFGTLVDWRSGVARDAEAVVADYGEAVVDWGAFADAWRARYDPQMETVRSGARPWANLDVLHREALDDVLHHFGLDGVTPEDRDRMTLAWHRLDPWPDVGEGLLRLRQRVLLAPCSNGHIALQVGLARHGGLPWDAIVGAELARAYKPDPVVYLRSVEALGLQPAEAMMVAAHPSDLRAAAACGLRTAFVPRPQEHGPDARRPPAADPGADIVAGDIVELAELLDAAPGP